MTNKLFYGDNLDVLRDELASGSVDLIYLDPPFNSNANYNVLFKSKTGEGARSRTFPSSTRRASNVPSARDEAAGKQGNLL